MTFGIGVIGATGFIGTPSRAEIRECTDEARIVALCARRQDRLQAAADEDGCDFITDDWRQVVDHPEVDLVLVIGAQNSSNCNRLREVAEAEGVPAYLVNGPEDVRDEWLVRVERVGITSGASTPERLVEEVVAKLGPTMVRNVEVVDEDVTFLLPRALR